VTKRRKKKQHPSTIKKTVKVRSTKLRKKELAGKKKNSTSLRLFDLEEGRERGLKNWKEGRRLSAFTQLLTRRKRRGKRWPSGPYPFLERGKWGEKGRKKKNKKKESLSIAPPVI